MSGPLEGIFVVSIDQAVAAPYTASRLAEAGARVIKIERSAGDFARGYDSVAHGESAYFVWLNRGKESIALDIKDPSDRALLHRMVSKADIFIQNLAPGAAERAGFGAAELRSGDPSLITCDINGYNEDGGYRDMKAYDLLVQAESGLTSITGSAGEPGRVGISIVDIATGMQAYNAILQALFHRERTGKGQAIKISLFDTIADLMTVPYLHQHYGGKAPSRVGLNHPSIAPYGAYATKSGGQVLISIQNDREWMNFCRDVLAKENLIDDPRFAENENRVANRPALNQEIDEVFSKMERGELAASLKSAGVAFGSLNSLADLESHQELRLTTVETSTGLVEMPAPPARISGSVVGTFAVPELDQHGDALRREFADPGEANSE